MTASAPLPFESWSRALNDQIYWRVHVENLVDSTQDVARAINARPGEAVVAYRQLRGKGRLGRPWLDTTGGGVAMTLVTWRDRPERQSILAAVAVAQAIETAATGVAVGLKWPNDLMANGRKLGGILIEQIDDRALIGVGINVLQDTFDPALGDSAISLRQLGRHVDRLDVMLRVLVEFTPVLKMRVSDEEATQGFARHDILAGSTCAFRVGEREIRGRVLRVDPMKGLAVLTETEGEVWLPAATTTVIKE